MKIDELARQAAVPVRLIRYLIAEGFVPSPAGPKSRPDYGPQHLRAIQLYQALRGGGLSQHDIRARMEEIGSAKTLGSPDAVKALGSLDEIVRLLAPGVEVRIIPALLPANLYPNEIAARVVGIIRSLTAAHEPESHHADAGTEN